MQKNVSGFTIVELLIVIVVIVILSLIGTQVFSGASDRASISRQDADRRQLITAANLARENNSQVLSDITGSTWSNGACPVYNHHPEPATLEKDGTDPDFPNCWPRYYQNLDAIGAASGMSLESLRSGDARGNPYMFDENENLADNCGTDRLLSYNIDGIGLAWGRSMDLPKSGYVTCP